MVRKNDTVTSEEDSHVEADVTSEPDVTSGTPVPEQEDFLQPRTSEVREAFPFPGDTQSGGTRNPAPDFISSNVAEQAKMYGSTIDPATGLTVTLDDLKARGIVVEDATPALPSK